MKRANPILAIAAVTAALGASCAQEARAPGEDPPRASRATDDLAFPGGIAPGQIMLTWTETGARGTERLDIDEAGGAQYRAEAPGAEVRALALVFTPAECSRLANELHDARLCELASERVERGGAGATLTSSIPDLECTLTLSDQGWQRSEPATRIHDAIRPFLERARAEAGEGK